MKKNPIAVISPSLFLKPFLVTLFTALSVLSFSQSLQAETLIDKVIAVVNDKVILKSELDSQVVTKRQELAAQNIPIQDLAALEAKVLDGMIMEALQLERAEQIGLQVSDDEINEQLQAIADKNNLSLLALRNQLNIEMADGFQRIRKAIKTKILIQKLRQAEVISQAHVTESEIAHYLQRQKLENSQVEVKLSHILIEIPDSATPAQRESALQKAQGLHQRIQSGEDFGQLAVRYSNGSKALNGGDLGWLKQDEIPTFFADAIRDLPPGKVSEIIQSPSGFHMIKLVDKRDMTSQAYQEYHLHRFIILSDDADPQNVPKNILNLAQSINSLGDFNALFEQFSDIPAEVNAQSDLGWKKIEAIPEAIRNPVMTLAKNRALTPIATHNGWMILFLEDTRLVDQALADQTQKAMQAIRVRKANEMFDLWLRRLKDEAFIEIRLNPAS